ncbi:hypothetical protein EDC32_10463 [Laceyella sacchari]|uniref:SAF domain-containing protein n=1 Tax=Laceyella sacchari TaxID=37482 RepID=UPI0010439A4E|nr:SAF domain-containing protein [Laceyella sacchari]TCW36613.1 hypothetical protein EDC32_10463 [Laceyella sacchari]
MQDAKRRALLFLVVALLLSAIAGYMFLQKVSEVDETLGNFTTVYVANKSIAVREPLKPEDFEAVKVPEQYVQQSAITNLQGIKLENGVFPITKLITVVQLQKGDLLTSNMLKSDTNLSSDTKRMVMLSRSEKVGFDDVFSYNDLVDIIVTMPNTKSVVYMQKVPVVALAKDQQGNVTGIGLEMGLTEAADFVDKQVNAINIRVLKAPNAEDINGTRNGGSNDKAAQKLNEQTKTKLPQTGGAPQDDLPGTDK